MQAHVKRVAKGRYELRAGLRYSDGWGNVVVLDEFSTRAEAAAAIVVWVARKCGVVQ